MCAGTDGLAAEGALVKVGISVVIGRGATTEKSQWRGGADLMPCAGRDENRIARGDWIFPAIDFHDGGAFQQVVEFLAEAVVMALGGGTGGEGGFGEALMGDGGVR